MADVDEDDISQLPNHNAEQVDLSDETQDFRFLASLECVTRMSIHHYPRRLT